MARTITFSESVAANAFLRQVVDVNDSEFNPLQELSQVRYFSAQPVTGLRTGFQLGSDTHASDAVPPVAASVSTRDHLLGSGIGAPNQKITISIRNTTAGALTLNGVIIIEPL